MFEVRPVPLPASRLPAVNVNVYISSDFMEREYANIINGIMMWERATGGMIAWELLGSDPMSRSMSNTLNIVYRRGTSNDAFVKQWDEKHENDEPKVVLFGQLTVGYVIGVPADPMEVYLIEDRLVTPRDEKLIAAHEFGHVLGLDHVKIEGSVMSANYNDKVNDITQSDLELFCKRFGCGDKLPRIPFVSSVRGAE